MTKTNNNNEPNVKMPELPETIDRAIRERFGEEVAPEIIDAVQDYARAAVALNTPGVDDWYAKINGAWRKIMSSHQIDPLDDDAILITQALSVAIKNMNNPAPTGVYAEKLNELVKKWRGIDKSYEIKADRKGQSDDMRDWYQGVGVAIGNCASELSAALAALAEGERA